MAEVVSKRLVCDVCGKDGDVLRWKVTRTSDSRTISPDLCSEHSEMLHDLYRRLPHGKRGHARKRPVYDSLDEARAAAKKATAKKAAKKS